MRVLRSLLSNSDFIRETCCTLVTMASGTAQLTQRPTQQLQGLASHVRSTPYHVLYTRRKPQSYLNLREVNLPTYHFWAKTLESTKACKELP
jgi:hypothetical protein